MIKGILFDKDGTLLKFDELWNEATKMDDAKVSP